MAKSFWDIDVVGTLTGAYREVVQFFKEDIWSMFAGFSFLFLLAVPLLLILAILWYLNAIDWVPESGSLKIGQAKIARAEVMAPTVTSGAGWSTSPRSARALVGVASKSEMA